VINETEKNLPVVDEEIALLRLRGSAHGRHLAAPRTSSEHRSTLVRLTVLLFVLPLDRFSCVWCVSGVRAATQKALGFKGFDGAG
jgi:hypothetical protein